MKKLFTLAACALMASAAWAGVVTLDMNNPLNPATIEYGDNGVWTQCYNDVDYTWLEFGNDKGTFMLSHLIDGEGASWGGYYWDGFTPAIGGDRTDYGQAGSSAGWTTMFGGCMAGGGCVINADGSVSADPAVPYFVAYYSSWASEGPSNQVMFVDNDGNSTFEPVGVYICNHPWPYYGCEHGDGFGSGFAEGDYFELIAHGVAADGSEKTVSINLVEFTDGQLIALNDWTFFDLSELGEVESVYFTMNSTDVGPYGMNTAAYFCMDKFQVKVADTPVDPVTVGAPVFQGYTIDGITGYGVGINPTTEGSEIMYRVLVWDPVAEEWVLRTDWTLYEGTEGEIWFENNGEKVRIEAYAFIGQNVSQDVAYEFTVATALDELMSGKTVAGVRYFNMAGQEMQQAEGLTIMVTTYTDGTTSAVKVIK